MEDPLEPDFFLLLDERERLIQMYMGWLRHCDLPCVGTFQFDERIPTEEAEEIFQRWVKPRRIRNRKELKWQGGPQYRMRAKISYFHVLIDGIQPCHLDDVIRRWESMAGKATLYFIEPESIGRSSDQDADEGWDYESRR